MPRAQDPTQSLLRWGIEHAEPGALAAAAEEMKAGKRPDLSTDMLKAIMGTSDADRMKECLMVIEGKWVDRDGNGEARQSDEVTDEDKYRAWDDLEMVRLPFPSKLRPKRTDFRNISNLLRSLHIRQRIAR